MLILGHRGAKWKDGSFQENSMDAFQQALDAGADGIETDVRLHNDTPVLHHDPIKLGAMRGLTLETLLDWAPDDFLLNLEIKDPAVVPGMIKLMKQYDKRYLITSFHHRAVWRLNMKMPDIDCGFLVSFSPLFFTIFESMIPVNFTHVVWDYEIYDEYLASKLPQYKHFLYRVPNHDIQGVDGIISDYVS